jgi:hypothetical protein
MLISRSKKVEFPLINILLFGIMVKTKIIKPPHPVYWITERMKIGGNEATSGKEPTETRVTTMRDLTSCRPWIAQNGRHDCLYKIYTDNQLVERWHYHQGKWLKAMREPANLRKKMDE